MAGELGFSTGPYVNTAVFCERVLQEKDGVLSLIRIIDQMNIPIPSSGLETGAPGPLVQPTLCVALKPGDARGRQTAQIVLEHPDTSRHEGPPISISFTGGPNQGTNLVLPMPIQVSSEGLYWADVLLNGRLMTRVPLQITYIVMPVPGIGPQAL